MSLHDGSRRDGAADAILAAEPLASLVAGRTIRWVADDDAIAGADLLHHDPADVSVSYRQLQDVADYRGALRDWFVPVAVGGLLLVIAPHAFLYDRSLVLPSRWSKRQRRLYTPASLLAEVEEALPPNAYRVRWVGDVDAGYDYGEPADEEPAGNSDVALVVERIAPPAWEVAEEPPPRDPHAPAPIANPFAFEPPRTRVEADVVSTARRVCILKLDHLGDLVMGTPALEAARRLFADAAIDLVVGPWNVAMAKQLGVADRVIPFEAFPRNSSEEEANVLSTLETFRSTIVDSYDLAIDLRADVDTRVLLQAVKAPVKAGIGAHGRFPFLDIALPLDSTRNEAERVGDTRISHSAFRVQDVGRRGHFGLYSDRATAERGYAIVWGPYLELDPGDYIFDFYLDLEVDRSPGLLRLDIALDEGRSVAEMFVSGPSKFHLPFRIDEPRTPFEARVSAVDGHDPISFGFYGGHLVKRGPGNVLHQSEYAGLLIELVRMRMAGRGLLRDVGGEWGAGA